MSLLLLNDIKAALLTVMSTVRHYDGTGAIQPYIVWAEDGELTSVWANGKLQHQAATGTIDLFTKAEYDSNFQAIQAALTTAGIAFRWESTQYEPDTKLIHHEWSWSIWLTEV